MELVKLMLLSVFAFSAIFTTINVIAHMIINSNDYKYSATITAFCWTMVLVITHMKG